MAKRSAPRESPKPPRSSEPAAAKTRTLPEAKRDAWFDGPDVVTMLRVYDTDVVFELPREKRTFSIGRSPERDLEIPGDFMSALHCSIERVGPALYVEDKGSYNGTYFDGRRATRFELRPGQTFNAATVRMLAMNDEMRASYPVFADLLGAEDEHTLPVSDFVRNTPCDMIVASAGDANLLILGEAGCDQARLAQTVHNVSLRRGREIVVVDRIPDDRALQREIIDRAARSTLVLSIGDASPVMDAAFCSMIFSASFHVRVIVLATTAARVSAVVGEEVATSLQRVRLRPLAQRSRAILHLLGRMLAERGTDMRVEHLTTDNRAALITYDWPENFDSLRTAAERLSLIVQHGSVRKTAEVLGLSSSAMHYWFKQLGLSLPLLRDARHA